MSQDNQDGRVVALRETLSTLLQRYKDMAFMESPEWETTEELPVKNAEELLDDPDTVVKEKEFYLMRKLSRKVEVYLEKASDPPFDPEQFDDYLDSLDDIEEEIQELIDNHRSLKKKQGIVRVD